MTENQPIEGTVLGKQVDYPTSYSPNLLVAVPRQINRSQYNIHAHQLPFVGFDVWHSYEAGFMCQSGLPVSGLLKIIYPSNNPSIVESKSLKLYLNSLNMERLEASREASIDQYKAIVTTDLSKLLETEVKVDFFNCDHTPKANPFEGYQLLELLDTIKDTTFNHFTEKPELLTTEKNESSDLKFATHLLRSNCKITHQPDWGSAYIHMKGDSKPDLKSILQYIVSFRNENHFHEEICEMLFKRLTDAFRPEQLLVTCIYTRRGGIDICPVRASHIDLIPEIFINSSQLTTKLLRQ